jgi:hypothetical protein
MHVTAPSLTSRIRRHPTASETPRIWAATIGDDSTWKDAYDSLESA